jgi:hypothetical protein
MSITMRGSMYITMGIWEFIPWMAVQNDGAFTSTLQIMRHLLHINAYSIMHRHIVMLVH